MAMVATNHESTQRFLSEAIVNYLDKPLAKLVGA
jgi:hypothetical protein